MKYELTESNVKDLIAWSRAGHALRVLRALENLKPVEVPATPEPAQAVQERERVLVEALETAAKFIDMSITLSSASFDEPQEPHSKWDYDAGLLVSDLRVLIQGGKL